MIGRVYTNELGIDSAILDFSYHPSSILSSNNEHGFAYMKTLEHLDIERFDINEQSCILYGNLDRIRNNAPSLQRHIGLISRYAAEKSGYGQTAKDQIRENLCQTLGYIVQKILPDRENNDTLRRIVASITGPFAAAANDPNELFYMLHGQPWWLEEELEYAQERQLAVDAFLADRKDS